jgi:hypothetical protein
VAERIEAAPRVVQYRRNSISPHPRGSSPIRRSHIAVADARHKPSNIVPQRQLHAQHNAVHRCTSQVDYRPLT